MKTIARRLATRGGSILLAAAIAAACSDNPAAPIETNVAGEFVLRANVVGTAVATLAVTVTAADIAVPLVFNIQQVNGVATGTLRLPPGNSRTILVQAFDNFGQLTHEGSKTINVVPGPNPPVSIPVVSRAGKLPIVATLGPVSVSVTALPATMTVGQSVQLKATVVGPNGDVLAIPVEWATTNPTVATIDQAGNVMAVGAGSVQIVATSTGVAAATQTTVTAP